MKRRKYPKHQERHGKRRLPEYQIWLQMKGRCTNRRNKRYHYYGGRGIKVCDRWMTSFEAFYRDVGPRPNDGKKYYLERPNNNGNYGPKNCIWTSIKVQSRNKRNNRYYSFQGRRMILVDLAEYVGLPYRVVRQRVRLYGWTIDKALATPLGALRKNSRHLTFRGKTQPMCKWVKQLGISKPTLQSRLKNGWSVEKALSTPVEKRQKRA